MNTVRSALVAFGEKFFDGFCRRIGLEIITRKFWAYSILRQEGKQIPHVVQVKRIHRLIFVELPALIVLENLSDAVFTGVIFHVGSPPKQRLISHDIVGIE